MRKLGVATLAVAGVMLSACGEGGGDSADITVSAGKGGGAELFEAIQAAQLDAETYKFDMTLALDGSQDLMSAEGGAEYLSETEANVSMTMSMAIDQSGAMSDMSFVMVDGVMYTNMFEAMGAPTETPYVAIDPESDDPASKIFSELFSQQSAMADVTAEFMNHVESIEVREVGDDEIDGAAVTQYELEIDGEAFAEIAGVSEDDLAALDLDGLTYSIWIDDEDLPVRVGFDMGKAGEMTMNLFEYGEPVTIETPAEDEVTDIGPALANLMGVDELSEEDLEQLTKAFGL